MQWPSTRDVILGTDQDNLGASVSVTPMSEAPIGQTATETTDSDFIAQCDSCSGTGKNILARPFSTLGSWRTHSNLLRSSR